MGFTAIGVIATIFFNLIHCSYMEHILSCNTTILNQCLGENEICIGNICVCDDDFVRYGEICISRDSIPTTNHDVTAAIVSISTIAIVILGLVIVIRKYNLIEYVRQKIELRRNHNIMYEDVMIGQDDPPLSP